MIMKESILKSVQDSIALKERFFKESIEDIIDVANIIANSYIAELMVLVIPIVSFIHF